MNHIAEEMMSYFGCGSDEDSLEHYGMPRRSGRYPYGSGEDPYQHDSRDFLGRVDELKKQGWTETPENIKKEFGLTTTQYRTEKALAKDERRMLEVAAAKSLKDDGLGATEIARKMSDRFGKTYNESTVRSLLDANSEARMNQAKETARFIKEQIDKRGMIDVGTGVERELNISKEKLNQALAILKAEGYPVYKGGIPQVTNKGQQTNQKVICPPGTEHKEIYNYENVHSLKEYISRDDGQSYEKKFNYPSSMDSKRLMIRYKEDGGIDKDGVVELRPGIADLSLGESRYSQVRIMVDGKKYIKGMAVYGDVKDFPDGVDVIFNTNKSKSVAKMDVLKNIKDDPDNPFGSLIKDADKGGQYWYDPKTGKRVSANTKGAKLGLINKRSDEGDWTDWKDALPSQFLSKQSLQMAKKQLNLAAADKVAEFDEIKSLTNPTVKKHLLGKFADSCDSAAVHLQAAALPGQKYHVIIPITTMKDTEIYAPNYENGTKLALIRYPHGGTFEIPVLTVNNKHAAAKKLLGTNVSDAVGINSKVAEQLSGADFDGDTVMCIPTNDKAGKVKVTSTRPLKGLEGFDPKTAYPERPGMRYMKNTGTQMGIISNLITDMTLKGATQDELARAVRHSMVVIDAEKHKLDYKQSEIDNGIASLKKKYQSYVDADGKVHSGGASTLISRSKGEKSVLKRQGSPQINMKGKKWYDPSKPEGSLIWRTADDVSYEVPKVNKRTGEVTTITKYRTQKSTRMAEATDARSLISDADTPMERAYADYANRMKTLANQARKEMASTGKIAYSANAKRIYQPEVESLMEKLNTALLNAPRERQAQLKANAEVNAKIKKAKDEGQELKKEDIKKTSQRALTKYRDSVGSVSRRDRSIKITDKEWEAIQAGAISENYLKKILDNTDIDNLRERATPRATTTLSKAKISQIKAMSNSNYTLSEIAKKLGVSSSTVSKYLKGGAA
jgi:Mn-dependent DtxR family transcriptional regulator